MAFPFFGRKRQQAVAESVTPSVGTPERSRPRRGARAYQSAKVTDLTASMVKMSRPPDGDIRRALNILRARSRHEFQSNDYAKSAIRLFKQNIVGSEGVVLQSRVTRADGQTPDRPARKAIETGWKEFCKRGVPEVTKRHSMIDCLNLCVQSLAVDGELILVAHSGTRRNEFGFAFEFVDPVLLDHELNVDLENGSVIRMGVELDQMGAPVAYHFLEADKLADDYQRGTFHKTHNRIDASRVLHLFLPEFVSQTRGVPWLATALLRANMLHGYEEAELVAARTAAAKMGFYIEGEDGASYRGDDKPADDPGLDGSDGYMDASEAGVFGRLPYGADFKPWDPQHPTQQYPFYVKALLRGMSAGVGVPYNSLANDLEGVNFSSLRQGNLDAQDTWRALQRLLCDSVCDWVYEKWLSAALLTGVLEVRPGASLNPGFRQKYRKKQWQPRSWEHVQPFEQARANDMKLKNRTTSPSQIIRESGRDPDEVYDEIAEDLQKMQERDIPIPEAMKDAPEPEPASSEPDDGDEGDDGDT